MSTTNANAALGNDPKLPPAESPSFCHAYATSRDHRQPSPRLPMTILQYESWLHSSFMASKTDFPDIPVSYRLQYVAFKTHFSASPLGYGHVLCHQHQQSPTPSFRQLQDINIQNLVLLPRNNTSPPNTESISSSPTEIPDQQDILFVVLIRIEMINNIDQLRLHLHPANTQVGS